MRRRTNVEWKVRDLSQDAFDTMLTPRQAARLAGVSVDQLAEWRDDDKGPPFELFGEDEEGANRVEYPRRDFFSWLESDPPDVESSREAPPFRQLDFGVDAEMNTIVKSAKKSARKLLAQDWRPGFTTEEDLIQCGVIAGRDEIASWQRRHRDALADPATPILRHRDIYHSIRKAQIRLKQTARKFGFREPPKKSDLPITEHRDYLENRHREWEEERSNHWASIRGPDDTLQPQHTKVFRRMENAFVFGMGGDTPFFLNLHCWSRSGNNARPVRIPETVASTLIDAGFRLSSPYWNELTAQVQKEIKAYAGTFIRIMRREINYEFPDIRYRPNGPWVYGISQGTYKIRIDHGIIIHWYTSYRLGSAVPRAREELKAYICGKRDERQCLKLTEAFFRGLNLDHGAHWQRHTSTEMPSSGPALCFGGGEPYCWDGAKWIALPDAAEDGVTTLPDKQWPSWEVAVPATHIANIGARRNALSVSGATPLVHIQRPPRTQARLRLTERLAVVSPDDLASSTNEQAAALWDYDGDEDEETPAAVHRSKYVQRQAGVRDPLADRRCIDPSLRTQGFVPDYAMAPHRLIEHCQVLLSVWPDFRKRRESWPADSALNRMVDKSTREARDQWQDQQSYEVHALRARNMAFLSDIDWDLFGNHELGLEGFYPHVGIVRDKPG